MLRQKKLIKKYFKYADIIKLSDMELKLLFNKKPGQFAGVFPRDKLVLLSLGKKGCAASYNGMIIKSTGIKVKAVDTTGAGDAFMAGALTEVIRLKKGLELSKSDLQQIADKANRQGVKAIMKKGAV